MSRMVYILFFFVSFSSFSSNFPDFRLRDFVSRENFSLFQETREKKVVINFWASWCTACAQEVGELERLKARYPEAVFLAINAGEKRHKIAKFLKRYKFSYKILEDPKKLFSKSVGVLKLPITIVLDKDKKVAYRDHTPPKGI